MSADSYAWTFLTSLVEPTVAGGGKSAEAECLQASKFAHLNVTSGHQRA